MRLQSISWHPCNHHFLRDDRIEDTSALPGFVPLQVDTRRAVYPVAPLATTLALAGWFTDSAHATSLISIVIKTVAVFARGHVSGLLPFANSAKPFQINSNPTFAQPSSRHALHVSSGAVREMPSLTLSRASAQVPHAGREGFDRNAAREVRRV
jgi:hypothetical protein